MTDSADTITVLATACIFAGLAADGVEVIRLGENAIFRLRTGEIARVARAGQQDAARREVAVSRWLYDSGVSAVEALPDIPQPVEVGRRCVTFWRALPPHRQGTPAQVAEALKRLHAQPIPIHLRLGELDPFVRLAERIEQAATVSADDRAWLRGRLAELQGQYAGIFRNLPKCVIHGDAWAGNVVATAAGTVVLVDLERCSIGLPEWDLVSTAIKHVTYASIDRSQYQQFCDAYGCDVTSSGCFSVLRDIRELRMTCSAAQQAAEKQGLAAEAQLRIDCLRGRHGARPWAWTPMV